MSSNDDFYFQILNGNFNSLSLKEKILNCIEKDKIELLYKLFSDSISTCNSVLSSLIINTTISTLLDIVNSGNVFDSLESFKDISLDDLLERIKGMDSEPINLDGASFKELADYVNNRVFIPRSISVIKKTILLMLKLQNNTNRFDKILNKLGACNNVDVRAFCCGHFNDYFNFFYDKEERVRNIAQFRSDFYDKWKKYSDEQKDFIDNMAKQFEEGNLRHIIFPFYIEPDELLAGFVGDMFEGRKTGPLHIDYDLFINVKPIYLCDRIFELAEEGNVKFSDKYQSQFESLFDNKKNKTLT